MPEGFIFVKVDYVLPAFFGIELDCEILQFIGVTMLSLVHKLFIIVIQ